MGQFWHLRFDSAKTKTAITQLIDTCDTINIMNKVLYKYMYTLLERYKETELSILAQKVNSMMFAKVFFVEMCRAQLENLFGQTSDKKHHK